MTFTGDFEAVQRVDEDQGKSLGAGMKRVLLSLLLIALAGTACSSGAVVASPQPEEPPVMVRNGLPGPAHHRLDALAGDWTVEMSTFIAGGTPEKPLAGQNVVSHWGWLEKTGNRFIQEEIEGTVNGGPYYRLGVLGYSNMDQRYEFNTFDRINATVMSYRGAHGSGDRPEITVSGEFTDQGVLGDAYIGKTIAMRTVIRFETPDRNVLELYFTPPGEPERLADRKVYTRKR